MVATWIRLFSEGSADDRALLGGKGANLAEMARLGLPVPPGFTVTTEACRAYFRTDGAIPDGLWDEIATGLSSIEKNTGRRFGDPERPLLLSVRSGAAISMPGMMDTVLNVGLTPEVVASLSRTHGERFAHDCERRLVQMMGKVVFGIDAHRFDAAHEEICAASRVDNDGDLDARALALLAARYRTILIAEGVDFSDDPLVQLRQTVEAVFRSWRSERAIAYRRAVGIAEDLGTAVTVQAMVFGNGGEDCATGVVFTRDPNTGERGLFGEYLTNAQGEDVVAGVRTPRPVAAMAEEPALAVAAADLRYLAEKLERHYGDLQDLEFTIEHGRLWMLQARSGKRTARAAVRIALDLVDEGLIDQRKAVRRVSPERIEELLHPRVVATGDEQVLARGLAASPGAAAGRIVFDPIEARLRGEAGEEIILVRAETAAEDFPGMDQARGILTARGGMTSHAAVVARGMGKPAVTGCSDLVIDLADGSCTIGGTTLRAGDEITIDGATGRIFAGRMETEQPDLGGDVARFLSWSDELRMLGVRANADTPSDAARARRLGAEGIGLCRTEHMFFGDGRIDRMRAMILATSPEERRPSLAALELAQTADFAGIFAAMDGFPVTIRTLDPPLHEFLPHGGEEAERLAAELGLTSRELANRVDGFREANPMLGHRGCRLGLTAPEITAMQARAIAAAAVACVRAGIQALPEVMIPFVSDAEELRRQRAVVEVAMESIFEREGLRVPVAIGTMIELPRAVMIADRIAKHADFISFGTNDLTQTTFGLSRDDAGRFLPFYIEEGILADDPFRVLDRAGVGRLVEMGTALARQTKPGIKVGICGEHGGEPASVAYCHEIGLDYVSCSPFRVPVARLAAAHAGLNDAPKDRPVDTLLATSPIPVAVLSYLD